MAEADAYFYDEANIGIDPNTVTIAMTGLMSAYDEYNSGVNPSDITIQQTGLAGAVDEMNTGVDAATQEEQSKLSAYDEENVIAYTAQKTGMPPTHN